MYNHKCKLVNPLINETIDTELDFKNDSSNELKNIHINWKKDEPLVMGKFIIKVTSSDKHTTEREGEIKSLEIPETIINK